MKKKLPKKQNRSQKIENANLAKATGGKRALKRNIRVPGDGKRIDF